MKKYIVLVALAIMAFTLPLTAQADDSALLNMLEEKATAGDLLRAGGVDYSQGLIIPYAVNGGGFGSGIAVYNKSTEIGTFLIASFDSGANLVASGPFTLVGGANVVAMIEDLMEEGSDPSPEHGFTLILGTNPFVADRFVFQAGGGFGELTMESSPY